MALGEIMSGYTLTADIHSASRRIWQQWSLGRHFGGNTYLKELLETCILHLFSTGCYDWIVTARSEDLSNA
jgi:hypothetical protein